MLKNLKITCGLVYSQAVLLKLVNKGVSREEAYKIVQTSAMDVWADQAKDLHSELSKSPEVKKYLSAEELNEIFDSKKTLKNVDYIFSRSVEID